jgi:DNA adenine methylase
MTEKEKFARNLEQFVTELGDYVGSGDGQWTVKGFIDIFKNVYTISSDTKIVSKILEIHLFPKILKFAQVNGYKIILAEHQNYYPDISFVKANNESVRFAVDLKTTYRIPLRPYLCNGFTLGSHGEYFENRASTKNIQFPYGSYAGNFCLGIIYDRADGATIDETKAYKIDDLHSIASVARNFHFFVAEKWKIASDKGGSGNTANIGSINNIADIVAGRGMFSRLGEEWFDEYWMNYRKITIPDGKGGSKKISTLRGFVKYKNGDLSLVVDKKKGGGVAMKIGAPPIKSQGIKTKLVPWIKSIIPNDFNGAWIEPFMGTGAVAFNVAPRRAILCDTNPHLIRFYTGIASGEITPEIVRDFLAREGEALLFKGESHYYFVRDRFNAEHSPLDFLFINRAGFNGMIRFNRKGGFNIPFCRKPKRFAQAYVTKIVNQVSWADKIIKTKEFSFKCQDFSLTINEASFNDIIYCDPPYIDRHVDYYNGWDDFNEQSLFGALSKFNGKFILSTWHHNDYRENEYVKNMWSKHRVLTQEHFYHVGGKEENRNPVVEALVTNFSPAPVEHREGHQAQYALFESPVAYGVV